MRLKIEIVMDNAIFHRDGRRIAGVEVSRLLRVLADDFEDEPLDTPNGPVVIHELNGNACGQVQVVL